MATSDQSRRLHASRVKNYSQVLYQQDKRFLDSEANQMQEGLFKYLRDIVTHGLKYDSGFVKASSFTAGASPTQIKMGGVTTDVNRANVNGFLIDILGTNSSNDYENIINLNAAPGTGTRNDLIYLEVWQSIIKQGTTVGDGFNKPSATEIYKYGNTLYGGTQIADEMLDPSLGLETADRVQIQYQIRVIDGATSLTGIACLDGSNTFSPALDPVTGESIVGLWEAYGTNTLYAKPEYDENNNPLGYGFHYAIPIAVVPRTAGEPNINLGTITDARLRVGVNQLDPDANYTMNSLTTTSDINMGGNLVATNGSGQTIGTPTNRFDTVYLNSVIDYTGNLNLNSSGTHFTFTTAGRLGMGTTTPDSSMHLIGIGSVPTVKIENTNNNDDAVIHLKTAQQTTGATLYADDSENRFKIDMEGGTAIYIDNTQNVNVPNGELIVNSYFRVSASQTLSIGTLSDSYRFTAQTGTDNDGIVLQDNSSTILGSIEKDGTAGTLRIYDGGIIKINLTGGSSDSYINAVGDIGINTTTPTEALHIVGNTKADQYIIGATPLRIKEVNSELQIRNFADTNYADLRVNNLMVSGDLTTAHSQEVFIGDSEILLNALITDNSQNTDAGIRFKRLDDETTRNIQSINLVGNQVVLDTLNGIQTGDLFEITGATDANNNGLYRVFGIAGATITIDSSFKTLSSSQVGTGGNVAKEIGSLFRWEETNNRFNVVKIDGSSSDLYVTGNIYGTNATSTLGIPTNRYAALYLSSDINYASNLTFTYTSSEHMRLTSSGFLGLGTTSPTNVLEVVRNQIGVTTILVKNTTGNAQLLAQNTNGATQILTSGTQGQLRTDTTLSTGLIVGTGAGDISFSPADSVAATLTSTGRLGLGSITPNSTLDVNGSIRGGYDADTTHYFGRGAIGYDGTNSDVFKISHLDNHNNTDYALLQNSSGSTSINSKAGQNLSLRTNGTERVRVNSNGFVDIITFSHANEGDYPLYLRHNNATNWLARFVNTGGNTSYGLVVEASGASTSEILRLATSSNDIRFRVKGDGKVGIKTDPAYDLDVNGSVNLTGTLYVNGAVYGSGQWDDQTTYINARNATDVIVTDTSHMGIGTTNPSSKLTVGLSPSLTALVGSKDYAGSGFSNLLHLENAAGTEHLVYTTGGRLALGTNAPNALAHIQETTALTYAELRLSGASRGGDLQFYDGTIAGASIYGGSSSDKSLFFATNGTNVAMKITPAGFVGIGTNNPDYILTIQGTNNPNTLHLHNTGTGGSGKSGLWLTDGTTGTTAADGFKIELDTGSGVRILQQENQPIYFYTNGIANERMRISGSGIQVNNLNLLNNTVSNTVTTLFLTSVADMVFKTDSDNNQTGQNFVWQTDVSTNLMTLTDSGYLGIGSAAPSRLLHLYGDTNVAVRMQDEGGGTWEISPFYASNDGNFVVNRLAGTGNVFIPTGNLSLGIAEAENWNSSYVALQLGGSSSFMATKALGGAYDTYWVSNAYYDGAWKKQATAGGSMISLENGTIRFYNSNSTAADAAFSWSQSMLINNNGQVGINTTVPSKILHVQVSGNDDGLRINNSVGSQMAAILQNGTASYFRLDDNSNNKIHLTSASSGLNYINNTGGKLGVGTSVPTQILSVHGNVNFNTTGADGNEARFLFSVGGASDSSQMRMYQADGATTGIYLNANGDCYFNTGNIAVKKTTASYPIDVLGDINISGSYRINGVSVNPQWTDAGVYIRPLNASNIAITDTERIGIGTTTPVSPLTITTTGGVQLTLQDSDVNASGEYWFVQSSGGNFYIGNSTDAGGNYASLVDRVIVNPAGEMTVGNRIYAAYDSNIASYLGRAAVGYVGHNDYAGFAHVDRNDSLNYALIQSSTGSTYLNCSTGENIYFRVNNGANVITVNSTGVAVVGSLTVGGTAVALNGHTHDDRYYTETELSTTGTSATTSGAYKIGTYDEFSITNTSTVQGVLNALDSYTYSHATSTSNPHSVTYTQVGAASSSHNHDTSYVNRTGDSMTGSLSISQSATSYSLSCANSRVTSSSIQGLVATADGVYTGTGNYNAGLYGQASGKQTCYGVYGRAVNSPAGAYTSYNYGIYGVANSGSNNYGVYGDGTQYGVYGGSAFGTGVYGGGISSSSTSAIGVYGSGGFQATGMYAIGYNGVGLKATSTFNYAIHALNGVIRSESGFSPFTGCHEVDREDRSLELGDVVILIDKEKIRKSYKSNDKRVIGVYLYDNFNGKCFIASLGDTIINDRENSSFEWDDKYADADLPQVKINKIEGVKVNNTNGEIEIGDLLCTSDIEGELMKQSDDLIRNYTFGKAGENVVFDSNGKSKILAYIYCG